MLLLAAKFLSNFLVLASMLGVLAVTALCLQLVRGEDRGVDPVALFQPFLVMALPLLALTAAAALLFETVPVLRGGLGQQSPGSASPWWWASRGSPPTRRSAASAPARPPTRYAPP